MKKFAIITVCLNVENLISDTISSILNQTNTDFEYLIKDGGSRDATTNIAESFIPAFAERGIPYRILSRPDQGIYDAMNQAVREVRGEWVLYMNAGDQLADSYVLETVAQSGCLDSADIVYGDCIDCKDASYLYRTAHPLEYIRNRSPFCHQSVFAKKNLYDEAQYQLKYRLCSDYALFFQWYREGKRFAYLPIAISIYDRTGLSSNGKAVAQELLHIHEEVLPRDEETIHMLRSEVARYDQKPPIFRRLLSRLIPSSVRAKRWEYKRKASGWKTEEEFFAEKAANGGRVNKVIEIRTDIQQKKDNT